MFKKQNKLINKNVSDYSYNDINELEWSLQSMFDNWLESTAKINTKNFITNDLETNLNLEFMFSPKPDSLCKIEFENNNNEYVKDNLENISSDYFSSLGKIISTLFISDKFSNITLEQIKTMILPPLKKGQFLISNYNDINTESKENYAFIIWANVSESINQRLMTNIDQPIMLKFDEWDCGNITWIVLTIGSNKLVNNLLKKLTTSSHHLGSIKIRKINNDRAYYAEEIDPGMLDIEISETQVRRNSPCPCGSGAKYKHCHGKLI